MTVPQETRIQVARIGEHWVRVSDGKITGESISLGSNKLIDLHPEFVCKIGPSIVISIDAPTSAFINPSAWLEIKITDSGLVGGASKSAQAYAGRHALTRWPWPEISESMRDKLREIIRHSYDENITCEDTVSAIRDLVPITNSRAKLIAQTETSQAQVGANFEAWKHSGVVSKVKWLAVGREVCPTCACNNGVIRILGEKFPSGDVMPLAHPGCSCIMAVHFD